MERIDVSETQYAGFWLRFLAYVIDYLLMYFIQIFAIVPLLAFFGIALISFDQLNELNPEEMLPFVIAAVGVFAIFGLFFAIIGWLYFAIMESSAQQATLGKMVLGIKVTDMQGNRITFLQATGRYFGKILSAIIFNIGFIMAGFTEKKQALHDLMAGCLVVKKTNPF